MPYHIIQIYAEKFDYKPNPQLSVFCTILFTTEMQSACFETQGDDLTVYGDLVMEGELKLQGAKNWRVVFLFDKMILITKKQDGFLVCKANIMASVKVLV